VGGWVDLSTADLANCIILYSQLNQLSLLFQSNPINHDSKGVSNFNFSEMEVLLDMAEVKPAVLQVRR